MYSLFLCHLHSFQNAGITQNSAKLYTTKLVWLVLPNFIPLFRSFCPFLPKGTISSFELDIFAQCKFSIMPHAYLWVRGRFGGVTIPFPHNSDKKTCERCIVPETHVFSLCCRLLIVQYCDVKPSRLVRSDETLKTDNRTGSSVSSNSNICVPQMSVSLCGMRMG